MVACGACLHRKDEVRPLRVLGQDQGPKAGVASRSSPISSVPYPSGRERLKKDAGPPPLLSEDLPFANVLGRPGHVHWLPFAFPGDLHSSAIHTHRDRALS